MICGFTETVTIFGKKNPKKPAWTILVSLQWECAIMMLVTRAPFTVTGVKTEILLLSYLFHKAKTKGGRKFVQILLLLNARNIKQLSWDPGSYSLKVSVWNFCFE